MKNLKVLIAALVVVMVSLACSLSLPAANTALSSGKGVSGQVAKPGGVIDKVTMATGTQGPLADPVNPTTEFTTTDTFHAVVHVANAQPGTIIKAVWYSVATSVESNKLINSSEYNAAGTGNIDFSLAPQSTWPTGTYQVELYVNNTLDQVMNFSVK